ncbi:MAG: hypothetical protein AAGD25_21770 [Cyanobacteria bacterium P01_F01_bin.150]
MVTQFSLSPRYTLDDEFSWLVGIDPVRRYWINVNGDGLTSIAIPGLMAPSHQAFKEALIGFRSLPIGGTMLLSTYTHKQLELRCVGENLYAIPYDVEGKQAWHLFDYETVEAFLLTAHPDWKCSAKDVELGRGLLTQVWLHQSAA